MASPYRNSDVAAVAAYHKAIADGAVEIVAFNIAASVWFARSPWADGSQGRARLRVLLRGQSQPGK